MRLRHDWEEIPFDKVPKWVRDRGFLANYNTSKLIKGRHYIYKVRKTDEVQGGAYYYYKTRRFHTYSKSELPLLWIKQKIIIPIIALILVLLFAIILYIILSRMYALVP